jgi:hypothetical protein
MNFRARIMVSSSQSPPRVTSKPSQPYLLVMRLISISVLASILNAEIGAAAVAGVSSLIAVGTGFNLQDVAADHIAGIGSDLSAIFEFSASFCYFIHGVRPPDILL